MKVSLPKIAILVSVIALVIHVWYPIDRYFRDLHEEEMERLARLLKPDFVLTSGDFAVRQTHTSVTVQNSGNGAAHNVKVTLRFRPVNRSFPGMVISQDYQNYDWLDLEFIPEILSGNYAMVLFPIGENQLESVIPEGAGWNFTNYEADVWISCNEIPTVSRHFIHTQFQL